MAVTMEVAFTMELNPCEGAKYLGIAMATGVLKICYEKRPEFAIVEADARNLLDGMLSGEGEKFEIHTIGEEVW